MDTVMQNIEAFRTQSESVLAAGMVDIDMSLFFMLGLFLVFAVLMHYLVFKPLIASQEARHQGMGGAREDASSYELKAAEIRIAYDARMTRARQDAVVIRDTIKRDATARAQESTSAVSREAEVRFEAAKVELAKFTEKARVEMKTHADTLSTELSAKLLGGNAP